MVQLLRYLGACCAIISIVHCQSSRQMQKDALHDMIEYARQFEHRSLEPHPVAAPNPNSMDDPVIRELFNEFLLQYNKKSIAQQTEEKLFTTTTTTQAPVHSFPVFIPEQEAATVVRARPALKTTPVQNRRLVSRFKIHNPETTTDNFASIPSTTPFPTVPSTTPFSTARTHITEPTIRVRTPMRQNKIDINSQTQKHVQRHRFPAEIVSQVSPIMIEEPNAANSEEAVFDDSEFRRQAESAKYEFASALDDEISGNLQQREEVRDGLAVRGKYSYSDGYFKRTVHYEADDRGYRVVKEEVETLDGPHTNPNGHAKVFSLVEGNSVNYEITKNDIRKKDPKSPMRI